MTTDTKETLGYLIDKLSQSSVPGHMHAKIVAYIVEHREQGSFLMAVVANNLKGAVAFADDINKPMLPAFVEFFYNHAPSQCWGSPEKVHEWLMQDVEQVRR